MDELELLSCLDGVDVEAQRREFERLEQASKDKRMAEELQNDLREADNQPLASSSSSSGRLDEIDGTAGDEAGDGAGETGPPLSFNAWQEPGPSTSTYLPLLTQFPGPSRQSWEDELQPVPGPSSASSSSSFSPPTSSQHLLLRIHSDQKLAEQLQEQERRENEKRRRMSETQSQQDAQVAMALQQEDETRRLEGVKEGGGGGGGGDDLMDDGKDDGLTLAQRLQEEEEKRQRLQLEHDEQLAHAIYQDESDQPPRQREDTSRDEELARQVAAQFEVTPPIQDKTIRPGGTQFSLTQPPNWWTVCPNCPPDSNRRYHLIEVGVGDAEWEEVTRPLREAGYIPERLLRVQNMKLFQRLEFEKYSMMMDTDGEEGYSVNETLLYHTSSAAVNTICREGLDQRLSRKGRFGNGVYFSDSPVKCNSYWKGGTGVRKMFACYVLLGKAKVYPKNKTSNGLLREPVGYDSVQGNVTGQNEYIIYSHYRALPAYVVEYSIPANPIPEP